MRLNRRIAVVLVSVGLSCSCATRQMRTSTLGTFCGNAGPRLNEAWQALSDAMNTPDGCAVDNGQRCEALKLQIRRLSVDCPTNPDVLMANALLAFEEKNFVRTQQILDDLIAMRVVYPEASVLRARLALEEGNPQFALRFLDEQIRQTGDHAGLRETYASALFLAGRFEDAEVQLMIAGKLGAPSWRISYGRGLIDEARGRFEDARQDYQEALREKPAWAPPESRIRALVATGKVAQ
jgi:tetratricopeptide (TPR) repeat protein